MALRSRDLPTYCWVQRKCWGGQEKASQVFFHWFKHHLSTAHPAALRVLLSKVSREGNQGIRAMRTGRAYPSTQGGGEKAGTGHGADENGWDV